MPFRAKRLVIPGGGFGGVYAALSLERIFHRDELLTRSGDSPMFERVRDGDRELVGQSKKELSLLGFQWRSDVLREL